MTHVTDHQQPDFLKTARAAIETPEVQDIMKRLSKFGLGVFIPHFHPMEGGTVPLPRDMVALERNQQVTFLRADDEALKGELVDDIGWRWDEVTQTVAKCARCFTIGCRH